MQGNLETSPPHLHHPLLPPQPRSTVFLEQYLVWQGHVDAALAAAETGAGAAAAASGQAALTSLLQVGGWACGVGAAGTPLLWVCGVCTGDSSKNEACTAGFVEQVEEMSGCKGVQGCKDATCTSKG